MMNKYKRIILSCSALMMSWLFIFNSAGPGGGYTNAPFDGQNCTNCHGGGSFGTTVTMQLLSGVTPVTTYLPGQAYTLRITAGGASPRLGFQTTAAFQGSNTNINNWGTLPPNTHNVSTGGHNYIEHTSPLNLSVIDIPWTAPSSTTTVVFYSSVNRVDFTGGSNNDQVVSGSISVQTGCAAINLPASLPNGTAGTAYNQTVTQSGATGTPSWAVTAGTLPAGLSLNSTNGQITGTPTTSGSSTFTVTVTGGNGCTGSQQYTITIGCPTITLSPGAGPLPAGTVGTAYSQAITKTGGTGTYNWTTTGSLPPGVTINSTSGLLSGTPTTTGTYNFTVTATGNGSCTGSQSYSITIGCPTMTVSPASIPTMTVGTAVNQTYSQTGGAGTITWSATGLPPGVTINPTTGLLSGTPTTTGSYNIVITATGNGPCTGTQTFNNTLVSCPPMSVSPGALGTMTVGTPFSQAFSQSGGSGTITWSFTGTLPPGLTLSGAGVLSGTPTVSGNYTFTITATGNGPCSASQTFTNFPVGCPTITINPSTLTTPIIVGSTYSQTFTQTGGVGPFTWTSTGTLPTGLTLNPTTGVLSGVPTTTGSYTFTIIATNTTSGCSGSRTYTVTVACATVTITPSTLPNTTVNTPYNQTISQSGGNFGTWNYTVTTGSLPPGLTLNPTTGVISGTTTQAGSYTFTVTGTSQYGCVGTQTYTIVVGCPTISLNPGTVPNAPIGQTYNQTITVTGSTNTFTFTSTGTLPTGITLSSAGVLSGTPTVAGSYTFTVTATDNFGCSTSTTYTIVVACPTITLAPGTLPPGNVGFTYSQTITVTGSTNTFTFSSTGTIPPGLTLNPTTGLLSGTPTTAGSYTFTVTATDSYGCTTNTTYTLVIAACTPLVLSPGTLPDGDVGYVYPNQTITQTGGTGTITWTSTGTLPPGLTLDPNTGVISGTPTATGTYTFTVIATDANTCSGTMTYTMDINCPVITLGPPFIAVDTAGQPYNQSVSQNGSNSTSQVYTISGGTLPPGLSISSNGVITGTCNTPGTYTFDVTMTDGYGCSATITYTLEVVCPVIVIDQSTIPAIFTNTPYNETLTQTGGTTPYTYTVSSGTLPGGITLSTGGQLSGTTGDYGNHTFTITVTDSNGCTGVQVYNIFIDWPVSVKGVTADKESIVLIPNIVTNETTVRITSNVSGKAQIRILDMTGKEVYNSVTTLERGGNSVKIYLNELAAGAYTLHVKPLNVRPVKFIKQ